jgi:Virulence factor BrkB
MLDPKQVASTIYQASAEQASKSFDRQTQQLDSVAKLRLEFFDRIALLDGGTIALSVTLVGSLASKNPHVPMRWITLLILSWIAFVLSMLLALTRNYIEHNRLSTAECNNSFLAVSQSSLPTSRLLVTYRISVSALAIRTSPRTRIALNAAVILKLPASSLKKRRGVPERRPKSSLAKLLLSISIDRVVKIHRELETRRSRMAGPRTKSPREVEAWMSANVVFSFGIIAILFALIFKFIPDTKIRWRDVRMGPAVTSVLFTVGKVLIGFYLGHSA